MMQTTRSITTESRYPSGQEGRSKDAVAQTVTLRRWTRTSMLIASIACLAIGSCPASGAQGKTARDNRTRDQQEMSSRATTPEYSSPNADYAVTSQLSRTASEADSMDVDVNVPWGGGLTRRLWENRMAAPDPNEDVEDRAALNDLIRRIRSVRFEDETSEPAFTAPTEPTTPTQVASITGPAQKPQVARAAPMPTPTSSSNPTEPPASLTPETLEKLSTALKDPNEVHDPLEMAELLFLSGRQIEATVFYEKALARTQPNDPATESDRAWILFQLGNCLRQTDMARARDMYMKLVSEYPGSPWTELAKAHGRLITWYQNARPEQLMAPPESQ
jgi:hypothetical protein